MVADAFRVPVSPSERPSLRSVYMRIVVVASLAPLSVAAH